MNGRRHLVLDLKGGPVECMEAIGDALDAVKARSDLVFLLAGMEQPCATMDVYMWQEAEYDRGQITFVDDRATPARYLEVETEDGRALEALQDTLPVVPFAALKQRAAEPDAEPAALVRIALASTDEPDPEAVSLIEAGLASNDLTQVDAAVTAAALTHWPAFVASLERVRERTDNDGIRRLAVHAIANCSGIGAAPVGS
jgi:hypothetical protein